VKAILGMRETPRPTHAADALAVAICHALASPLLRAAR
jgi:Holliday junction resolvasome RuvABC endonuclease subunit